MSVGILGGLSAAIAVAEKLGGANGLIEKITSIVDRVVPDPNQRAAAALDLQRLVHAEKMAAAQAATELAKAQLADATVQNIEDAKGRRWWSLGGRSKTWAIVNVALLYALLIQPLGTWVMSYVSAWNDINFPPPPAIDTPTVLLILGTLLTGAGLDVARQKLGAK